MDFEDCLEDGDVPKWLETKRSGKVLKTSIKAEKPSRRYRQSMKQYVPLGSSESTFAEMMGSIYPPLNPDWNGPIGSYTSEAKKKLLGCD